MQPAIASQTFREPGSKIHHALKDQKASNKLDYIGDTDDNLHDTMNPTRPSKSLMEDIWKSEELGTNLTHRIS